MTDKKKAAPKKAPLDDTSSHFQRLIAPLETDSPCSAFLDGIGFLPFGTKPEKE